MSVFPCKDALLLLEALSVGLLRLDLCGEKLEAMLVQPDLGGFTVSLPEQFDQVKEQHKQMKNSECRLLSYPRCDLVFADSTLQCRHGKIYAYAKNGRRLVGGHVHMDFPSVGATETIIMGAVLADGDTTITNGAQVGVQSAKQLEPLLLRM